MTWSVPRLWPGETGFILGGGPSLRGFDAEVLRTHGRVIAINEAGLAGEPGADDEKPHAPWADVLYWADKRWFNWNHKRLGEHRGRFKIARLKPDIETGQDIKVLPQSSEALSQDPRKLSGFCSGGSAINLAYLFGLNPIVLLGFDMRGGDQGDNWHGRHKQGSDRSRYVSHFMPPIARMAWPLKQRGVAVVNCTPGSALTCFPKMPLEALLMDDKTILQPGLTKQIDAAWAEGGIVGDAVVDPAAAESEPGLADHTGLELCPAYVLEAAIAQFCVFDSLRVTVRLRGADIVTRRTAEWWQLKLSNAFPEVVIAEVDDDKAVFLCRKT